MSVFMAWQSGRESSLSDAPAGASLFSPSQITVYQLRQLAGKCRVQYAGTQSEILTFDGEGEKERRRIAVGPKWPLNLRKRGMKGNGCGLGFGRPSEAYRDGGEWDDWGLGLLLR